MYTLFSVLVQNWFLIKSYRINYMDPQKRTILTFYFHAVAVIQVRELGKDDENVVEFSGF